MPDNLRTIRRRIMGVKNTRQLTRAMKMVAAAKLRRSQERVEGGRTYLKLLSNMIVAAQAEWHGDEEFNLNPLGGDASACMVLTSDRGLCGSYNSNIIKAAQKLRRDHPQTHFILFGKKVIDNFRKNNFSVLLSFPDFFQRFSRFNQSFSVAAATMEELLKKCKQHQVGSLQAIYTRFVSAGVQKLSQRVLLPISVEGQTGAAAAPLLMEPNPRQVLSELAKLYCRYSFFNIAAEAVASENGARMTAMDAATKNAKDMIDRLTLVMNRARQATITKELLEIIGGAEALEK